ncbi:intermembrane phospholipid transport protein YdbH family protein [Spirabiliibacterium falconis]|uniref:intermembrane phospholipid transport protein YdbH family protein n=1 Tax=Spirabiliibacterium falconis TaxID=572023 RepID=UPI001AAD1472|nr:YdbH domain-containing protein [Spirabiliibacterium falconis]MBE2894680.1 hypothetical protein [Spirabiliibacterium falconis]
MGKKLLIGAGVAFFALTGLLSWVVFGDGLQKIANHFLSPDFRIVWQPKLAISRQGLSAPQVQLFSEKHHCQIVALDDTRFFWRAREISADKVQVNYACVHKLITEERAETSDKTLSLSALTALIPIGHITINHLTFTDTHLIDNPSLRTLLQSESAVNVSQADDGLQLSLTTQHNGANLLGASVHLQGNQLHGTLDYQPDDGIENTVQFNATLAEDIAQLPEKAQLDYRWRWGDVFVPQGKITLDWQGKRGTLSLFETVDGHDEKRVNLPFEWLGKQLRIEKAGFQWDKHVPQPINGFIDLDLATRDEQSLLTGQDITLNFRLSLLTNGEKGKGVIVIQGKNGQLNAGQLHVALQANGNVKSGDAVFYAQLPMHLEGSVSEPHLRFLSGALLRMQGKTDYIDIQELRLPLAGVSISPFGVNGRLQAILKGQTDQLNRIDLHLDGKANEFIAGIQSLFKVRSGDGVSTEHIANMWQWKFWGSAGVNVLHNTVSLQGRGQWQDNRIDIKQFDGQMTAFALSGVRVQPLDMTIATPIHWDYQHDSLQGGLVVSNRYIEFDYGGKFEQPSMTMTLSGKDFSHLAIKGELSANKLGPITLFARYQEQRLKGNIYWPVQSAKVFQSLFPPQMNWLIKQGQIRGQTAFSITPEQGVVAGGHFAIEQGRIKLPDGEIKGITFSLPYRYFDQHFQLGVKAPVSVNVAEMENNGLRATDLSVKVQGNYPYSAKSPLKLSQLRLALLGGELSVSHFALPQRDVAHFKLQQIDLAQVLSLLQYNQVSATGLLNADLPFWIDGKTCIICDGVIEQDNQWHIKLSPALVEQVKAKGGMTEQILLDLLHEMAVFDSSISVNLHNNGLGLMKAKIHATNAQGNPVTLNYNHKENLFDLWYSINFGNTLEQQLDYLLERQQTRK